MRFLLLALMLFSFIGVGELAAADNQIRFVQVNGKRYVYLRDVANYYGMTMTAGSRLITMQNRFAKLTFTMEKQTGFINGLNVTYLAPLAVKNGDYLICEQDFLAFIDPILRDRAAPRQPVRTIMLDAGHGGNDVGGKGRLYYEKEIALSMVRKVRFYLEKMGYRVVLTRNTDIFLPLETRTDMCRRVKPDLFIAIHTNAATNRSVCGIETFIMPPAGINSTYGARDMSYETNNKYDLNNSRFGYELHRSMTDSTGAFDRGIKRARFFVLKHAVCPAVLLEIGFISNSFEERRLGENSYQDTLAQAIANGIANYDRAVSR